MSGTAEKPAAVEAFRALLETGRPLLVGRAELAELDAAGRARWNEQGELVGIFGLSVEPTRHELEVDGKRRWTWCAYDALGILAALGRGGRIRSRSPHRDAPLEIEFEGGRPAAGEAALFLPEGPVSSVGEEWCPQANLFPDAKTARGWAQAAGVAGRVVGLAEAAAAGAAHWAPLVRGGPA